MGDNNTVKKKPRRNISVVEKRIKETLHGGEVKTLRYSVIPCDLKKTLRNNPYKKKILDIFECEANTQGVYRKVVGMLANWMILECLSNGQDIPRINKTLYDRCWSAVDIRRSGSGKDSNPVLPYLDSFVSATGLDLKTLPESTKFDLRQAITRDMETSAVNSITVNLEKRVSSYIGHRITNLPSTQGVQKKLVKALIAKITRRAIKGTIKVEDGFNPGHEGISLIELNDVLCEIGSHIQTIIQTDVSKSRDTILRKNAHLLVPLLYKISMTYNSVSKHRRQIHEMITTSTLGFNEMTRSAQRAILKPHYIQNGLLLPGKEFAVLPDWQLRPAFVEYTTTELQVMFGKKLGSLTNFETRVFDLNHIRHLKNPDWYLMGFRTDGVQIQLRLGSLSSRHPQAPNTPALSEAGYSGIIPPSKKVDIRLQSRGVHRITKDRFDNKKLTTNQGVEDITAVIVDPGSVKPVEVREIRILDSENASAIEEHTLKTWSMTENDWVKESQAKLLRTREKLRRERKSLYSTVLEKLRHTTKRTSSIDTYLEYVTTFVQNLKVLKRELLNRGRKVTRWLNSKNKQKALDKLADRLMRGDENLCKKRVLFFGDGTFGTTRGHIGVPRKELLKKCGSRGKVFVITEWGTSKYCPHCGEEMVNVEGSHRVRSCSSDPNVTIPCPFTIRNVDRDECATISLAMCATWAVKWHRRPPQFCSNRD